MKQLILHVGSHKTGTTTLQRFMMVNAKQLESQGLYVATPPGVYPKTNSDRSAGFIKFMARKKTGHFTWKDKMNKTVAQDKRYIAGALENHDRIYLSDERLFHDGSQDPRYWDAIKEAAAECGFDEVVVVVYLRRQDEFIASFWSQFAKLSQSESIQKFIRNDSNQKLLDYLGNLRRMEAAFGRENMVVRVYDRDLLVGGDICRDFFDAIGLEWNDDFEVVRSMNPSLKFSVAEIKRIANSVPNYKKADNFLKKVAFDTSKASEPCSAITGEELWEVFAARSEDNAVIAREYLGREDGVLFPSATSPLASMDSFTPEMMHDVCYFFADALVVEHQRAVELEERVQKLERALAKDSERSKGKKSKGKKGKEGKKLAVLVPLGKAGRFVKKRIVKKGR